MPRSHARAISVLLRLLGYGWSGWSAAEADDAPISNGLIATEDGRPGPLMDGFLQPEEHDLSDICTRTTDVIYGRMHGMALTMDVYTPKRGGNGAGIVQVVSGGLWSGPEYRRMAIIMKNVRALVGSGYVVFAALHRSQPMYTLYEIQNDVPRGAVYPPSRTAFRRRSRASGGHGGFVRRTPRSAGSHRGR